MASSVYRKVSDEIIEQKCSTCYKKKKVRQSEKFCVECNNHFCRECLQHHDFLHEDHTLQEPSMSVCQVLLPTDRCTKHATKLIDTYCKDHDEIGCNMCAFEKHRSCKTVLYIPNEVGQLFKKEELQQTIAELDRVTDMLTKGGRLRDRHTEQLQTEKEKQLSAVDSYVETLVAIINKLGQAEKKKLINKFKEVEDMLQINSAACQTVEKKVQKYRGQLDGQDENKAQLFVTTKRSQKSTAVADQLVQDLQEITKNKSPQFEPDRQIEHYLSGIQSLKSVFDKPLEGKRNINIQPESTLTRQPELYKVGQRREVNVRINEDKHYCIIFGSCLLLDGSLLLTDYFNFKLKRLNTNSYTVTDHCNLPSPPRGVCCISLQEAAVCLFNKTIQFISLGPKKMTLTRSINLSHSCFGISYWDNKLHVSNWGSDVHIYTLSGSLVKPGNLGLSATHNITFSHPGGTLYIADLTLGLVGVDVSGREIFRYCGLGLDSCTSVCVDGSGSVFVGGNTSGNVVQVTERGHLVGEVVPRSASLQRPGAMSFDCIRKRLFVAGFSNNVTVFEMI